MSYSLCYDGYNQSAHTEVSMTLRSANGGDERPELCPTMQCTDYKEPIAIVIQPPRKENNQ